MTGYYAKRLHTASEWAAEIEARERYDWRPKKTPAELGYRGATSSLNGFEDGGSWGRRFEIHTDYHIRPEGYPEGYQEKLGFTTEYWEIVTTDAPPVVQENREYFGSFCNQAETQRQFERLQEAQRRARLLLAIFELRALNTDAARECAANIQRDLLIPAAMR